MSQSRKPAPKKIAQPVTRNTQTPTRPQPVIRSYDKSKAQRDAGREMHHNDIVFLLGAAGTGKTHCALEFACQEILSGRRSRLIITRPIVEFGESLGFIKGTIDDKVAPYLLPLMRCLTRIVGPPKSPDREIVEHAIEVVPLAYMQGHTFDDAIAILDEAQNATYSQLKMFLTRIGENSCLIIDGDPTQCQLDGEPAMLNILGKLDGMPGFASVEFTENMRHPRITEILRRI